MASLAFFFFFFFFLVCFWTPVIPRMSMQWQKLQMTRNSTGKDMAPSWAKSFKLVPSNYSVLTLGPDFPQATMQSVPADVRLKKSQSCNVSGEEHQERGEKEYLPSHAILTILGMLPSHSHHGNRTVETSSHEEGWFHPHVNEALPGSERQVGQKGGFSTGIHQIISSSSEGRPLYGFSRALDQLEK